jgi:hypothetical protein
MNGETEALRIIRDLAENAKKIKKSLDGGELRESSRLVGERVDLIEGLRELKDAKVSVASSDIKDEVNLLMKNIQENLSETVSTMKARNVALLKELAKISGTKRIAAYKITQGISLGQGGRHGY